MGAERLEKQEDPVICLRPHHLLCMRGFQGRGYSPAFVENMTSVISRLSKEPQTEVCLQVTTDDLCSRCPHKMAEGICDTDEKIQGYDHRALELLGLQEKTAPFLYWKQAVDQALDAGVREAICGDCAWSEDCLLVRELQEDESKPA